MKLYHFPASPNVRRVLATAAYLGIELEEEIVNIAKGGARTPEFLAINPNGRIPTLVDGDFVLWESNAIAQYLCDVARAQGNPKAEALLPSDPRGRADVARWQAWQMNHLGPPAQILAFENLVKRMFLGQEPDPAEVQRGLERFRPQAAILEAFLGDHEWLVGDAVTLADFAVGAVLMYAPMSGIPMHEYPKISAWLARLDTIPAWRDTAPKMG